MSTKLDNIVVNMLTIFPLINKRLFHPMTCLQETDLTPTHLHILITLDKIGPIHTTELGNRLSILKSNLTPLINKLIQHGLVERIHSTKDRRYIFLQITEKGHQLLIEKKQSMQSSLKIKLSVLDEVDLEELDRSLQAINSILSKLQADQK